MIVCPDFLFSTSINFCLYSGGKVKILFHRLHSTYGITWSDKYLYLSTNGFVKKIGADLNVLKALKISQELHQILFVNNKLYVVIPLENSIGVYDEDLNLVKKIKLQGENTHMNSIFFKNDYFYLCHHGGNDKAGAHVSVHDSDFTEKFKFTNIGFQNHNAYIKDEHIYTLSSATSSIVKYDIQKGTLNKLKLEENYFARGLATFGQYFLVGMAPLAKREDRDNEPSKIVVVKNDLTSVEQKINLEFGGQMREVRTLVADPSHNQINFPFIREISTTTEPRLI